MTHGAQRNPRSGAQKLRRKRQRAGLRLSRFRICRSACFAPQRGDPPRIGVAIGDRILDLAAAANALPGLAAETHRRLCRSRQLNRLMALGPQAWSALRLALSRALSIEQRRREAAAASDADGAGRDAAAGRRSATSPIFSPRSFTPAMPAGMFRPDNPLMPNYKYVPVAYHSRASSIRVSGTPFKRPRGQRKGPNDAAPSYGPSRNLDFELELGIYIGTPSELGEPVPIGQRGGPRFRLSACSTTGRRATSRPGNISRSARSSARISPPRFRPGW